MLHDPLLDGSSVPPPPPPARRRARTPKPATSAKILATGLSTTAMLGMTAGYALAGRNDTPAPSPTLPPTVPVPPQGSGNVSVPQTLPGASSATTSSNPASPDATTPPAASPVVTAPVVGTPGTAAPVVTAPPTDVVEIPVPATPGNASGGWNSQQSSGSH